MAGNTIRQERHVDYDALNILVADDFSSFRNTVFGMLQRMGVKRVETAATAQAVIDICGKQRFDIILCDYNLGDGKTGQHVLEELRFKKIISKKTVFILVSAEAARTIVMSAYDCEPDDYLMKPVTNGMLKQRIDKMLLQRLIFAEVYTSLEKADVAGAIDRLIDLSLAQDRYAIFAQKWLGELFLNAGQVVQAERLYIKALEVRQLDWARLGLAKCKLARGEHKTAMQWLEKVIDENPLLLPAYDALAETFKTQGDFTSQQDAIRRSVDISPMSILRQKKLGNIAKLNNDLVTALEAKRKTVKLGGLSCYGSPTDALDFARTAVKCAEAGIDVGPNIIKEVEKSMESPEIRDDENNLPAQCYSLLANLYLALGDSDKAREYIAQAKSEFNSEDDDIYAHLDYLYMLVGLGNTEEVEHYLSFLLKKFAGDQDALQLLDGLLSEPASEQSKEMVASVNKEGIALYNASKFDEAITCFEKASTMFPKHVGLQLNILQALVGKLKVVGNESTLAEQCNVRLEEMIKQVTPGHPQFDRYQKIKKMALLTHGSP